MHSKELPGGALTPLSGLKSAVKARRQTAIVISIALFACWFFEFQLPMIMAIVLGLFFLDGLGMAGKGREVIQSIQKSISQS